MELNGLTRRVFSEYSGIRIPEGACSPSDRSNIRWHMLSGREIFFFGKHDLVIKTWSRNH